MRLATNPIAFLLSSLFAATLLADEQALPIDGILPKIGDDWIRRADGGVSGDYSWVNFDLKEKPGEVLSYVLWKVGPTMELTSGPMIQASIEIFRSDGSARFSRSKTGQPITDTVRHHIISINLRGSEFERNVDTIEYTYIYGEVEGAVATMAHGYCMVVGESAFFVQHTSNQLITSELAFEMATDLLSHHFQLTGKPHSYYKETSSKK